MAFLRSRPVRVLPALLLPLALVTLLVAGAGPARAHSVDGLMTVTAAEAPAPRSVRVEVGIVYANDNDPAEEATVTATLTGPAGEAVGPLPLERLQGARYGAEVPVPAGGTWTAEITATGPAATTTATIEVPDAPTMTAPAPTTATTGPPATPAPPTGVADGATADDGTSAPVAATAAVVVLALSAGGAYAVTRRRLER
jgi:hypothetical protein